ncbi:hypothetical protein [Streptomyces sp. NPDC054975]
MQLREAAEGAFRYALRNGGWTNVQIENGLQTYQDSVAHEMAERIRAVGVDIPADMSEVGKTIRQARAAAADLIDPYVDSL